MMNKSIKGIVLSQLEYREYDMILSVLTQEQGLIKIVARGIKKLNSKNASGCLPFSLSNFHIQFHENKNMHTLQTAELIESYRYIREDLRKQAIATFCCECIEKSGEDFYGYEYLLQLFELLKDDECHLLLCMFLVVIMKIHGIEVYVDGCMNCHGQKHICAISITKGGFVCENCYTLRTDHKFPKNELQVFRYLCKADFTHYHVLSGKITCTTKMFDILYSFFEEYAGISVRSYQFLKKVLYMFEDI